MLRIHNTPLYTCLSSQHSYPNQYQSSKNKQASKYNTVSPSTSLRLKGLAQARRARSGETCSLRRDVLAQASPPRPGEGSKRHPEINAGSRLGEIPLTWARCLLAQKLSESPGRLFARTGQGEPLFVSPRRD